MLDALVGYAHRKGLVVEPGFAPKDIRWLLSVSEEGQFTGLVPLGEKNTPRRFVCCPDLLKNQIDSKAIREALGAEIGVNFLYEASRFVSRDIPEADEIERERVTKKHDAVVKLLSLASEEIPILVPLVEMLQDEEALQQLREEMRQQKTNPIHTITFAVGDKLILDDDCWHKWWRTFLKKSFGRMEQDAPAVPHMACFATGELVTPAATHPKVTKLGVGANTTGASLIGYDKDAFASFGLTQGENAAVSEDAAAAYRAALDSLLSSAPLLGQMRVAFWWDRDVRDEDSLFKDAFDPSAEENALKRARTLLTAIRSGEKANLGKSRYFAMALTGAAGRVMVRDYLTGTMEDLAEAVTTWFDDLGIVNVNGAKIANLPGLSRLLRCVLPKKLPSQKDDDYIKPVRMLQQPLWRAALDPNLPIPTAALTRLIGTHKAHMLTGEFEKAVHSQGITLGTIYTRMGLIKAHYNRHHRGKYQMQPTLSPDHPEPAYHCGRLMCLLAAIQEKALGSEINAGVVQRYYGAASTTPGLVLGRLTRLSQHHLANIRRDKPGLVFWLESQLAGVWNALGASLPATLTLEQQSLFALGYYQQLAFNRTKKSGNPEAPESDNATEETEEVQ